MLKATELMIGDKVYYDPNVFNDDEYVPDKPLEVCTIESGEDIDLAVEGCYSGIPLTPEILEKNGFLYEKDYGSYYRSRYGDIAGAKYVTIGWCFGKMREYDIQNADNTGILSPKRASFGRCAIFVHELQHLLKDAHLYDLAENFTLPEIKNE